MIPDSFRSVTIATKDLKRLLLIKFIRSVELEEMTPSQRRNKAYISKSREENSQCELLSTYKKDTHTEIRLQQ